MAIALGVIGAYGLVFFPTYRFMGPSAVTLAVIPVAAAGWLLGLWAGLLSGLFCFPLNLLLLNLVGQPGWTVLTGTGGGALGTFLLVLIGGVVGRISDLGQQAARELAARREAEEKLRASETRFRALIEHSADAISLLNAEGTAVYDSPAAPGLLGYAPDELIGRNVLALIHPEDKPHIQELFRRLAQMPGSKVSAVFRFPHKSGQWLWLEAVGSNLLAEPSVNAIVINYRDITERKQAEAALREANQRAIREYERLLERLAYLAQTVGTARDLTSVFRGLREFAEASVPCNGLFVSLYDPARQERICVYSGGDSEEDDVSTLPPMPMTDSPHSRAVASGQVIVTNDLQAALAGKPVVTLRADKDPRLPQSSLAAPLVVLGRVIGAFEIQSVERAAYTPEHVTAMQMAANLAAIAAENVQLLERERQARRAAQASEERYRTLAEAAHDAIFIINRDDRMEYLNSFAAGPFHARPEDLVGKLRTDLFPSDVAERQKRGLQRVFESRLPMYAESRVRYPDYEAWLGTWLAPIFDQAGEVQAVLGISRDITERKAAEEALRRRAEELEALAQVSSALRQAQNLAEIRPIILEATLRAMGAQAGTFFLLDADTQELYVAAAIGYPVDVGQLRLRLGHGLAGQCAQSGSPILTGDIAADPRIVMPEVFQELHKAFCVPLKSAEGLVGVLLISFAAMGQPTSDEVNLLTAIAEMAGSALHRASLFDETQTRAAQLALLYDAGLALNSMLEPRELLAFLFKIAQDALRAERAAFFRFDAAEEALRLEMPLAFAETSLMALNDVRFRAREDDGPVGWVAQHRVLLNLPDASTEPRAIAVDPEIRSSLWVPVEHARQLSGVLAVFSTRVKAFTPHDERLLVLFANQAAVAIENARLFAETQRRLERLQILHTVGTAISASLDLRFTLDVLVKQVTTEVHVDAVGVLLLNPHTQTLDYFGGHGFHTAALQHTRLRLGEGYAGRAALERQIVRIADLRVRHTDFLRSPLFAAEAFVSGFFVPLIAKGQVKGVLEIFHRTRLDPDAEWLGFVESLAVQAALAIDNAELFEGQQRLNVELALAYEATIEGWGRALELRDRETEGHTRRVTEMTLRLARAMGMSDTELAPVRWGALLHDIGKMGVPDRILLKPGPLTEEDWAIMQQHPQWAYDLRKRSGISR